MEPSVRAADGPGPERLYSFRDILRAQGHQAPARYRHLVAADPRRGLPLRERGAEDLARLTLMGDGVSVYECTTPDEVVDLLAGGQGVFGIALGRIWREVGGTLADLPAERADRAPGRAARRPPAPAPQPQPARPEPCLRSVTAGACPCYPRAT